MVLSVATRTSLITGLPARVTARRTISERFRPRYFGPPQAGGDPNFFLEEKQKLWEIGGTAWLPFSSFESPDYLDGSLPGDRGFDPFGLAQSWSNPPDWAKGSPEEARLPWLYEAESYNGRVAMLAVVGILTVELQGKGPWWEIPSHLDYFGLPYIVGVVAAHVCFAFMEKKRLENWQTLGETGYFFFDGAFDPLGATSDYNRQAEIRNCRLAMLAALGFAVQAWVTGKGPIENAADHLRDPFGANIFTYEKGPLVVGIFAAISVAVHVAEAARNNKASKKSTTRGFAN